MDTATSICLGCGAEVAGDCEDCFEKLKATLATGHWPLETSLSPAALRHVMQAVHDYLAKLFVHRYNTPVAESEQDELKNLVNIIRAHLQHLRGDRKPKDPLLL